MSDIYCPRHHRSEHLTDGEAEDLIYGGISWPCATIRALARGDS